MSSDVEGIVSILTGRWRSQILYTGVALGVFDNISTMTPTTLDHLVETLHVDPARFSRLLRALAGLSLLIWWPDGGLLATDAGALLASSHPHSLRDRVLLEEGPDHYTVWKHLPALVKDSKIRDGMSAEFGASLFGHAAQDPAYGSLFDRAMTSYSRAEATSISQALEGTMDQPSVICDVGGGHGHLIQALLNRRPSAKGMVLELPATLESQGAMAAQNERLTFIPGDMFSKVPNADVYLLKHILHDWSDEESLQVLKVIRTSAKAGAELRIFEWLVPDTPDDSFANLMDIHMMCATGGQERRAAEYERLLGEAGWKLKERVDIRSSSLSMLVAHAV